MRYLALENLQVIAGRVVDGDVQVRDLGLLESAAHRPRTSAFGSAAYPALHDKAAALRHWAVSHRALVDANRRLGLASVIAYLGISGWRLTPSNDDAYDLVFSVPSGRVTDVTAMASVLGAGSEEAPPR